MEKKTRSKKYWKMINPIMAEIIRTLHKHGGYMTANEIHDKTGYAPATIRKYLELLEKKTVVIESTKSGAIRALVNKEKKGKRGKLRRYILNYELIFEDEILPGFKKKK